MALEQDDLSKIAELIEKNNKTLLTGSIQESIKTAIDGLSENFGTQIGGVVARNKKAMAEINNSLKEIQDKYAASFTEIKNQISNPPSPKDNQDTKDNDDDKLLEQITNQASQIETLTKAIQEEQSARQTLQQEAEKEKANLQQQTIYNQFISDVSEKVVDPNNFLQTCINKGKILYQNGQLLVDTGRLNSQGEKVFDPATKHVDTILQNGLGYFAKPRAGNGSGSAPNNQEGGGTSSSQYFTEEEQSSDLDATSIYEALKAGKKEQVDNEYRETLK